jgi:hypothetical protein
MPSRWLVAVTLALALVGSAAADEGEILISPGDSVAVKGTHVVCDALTVGDVGTIQCATADPSGPRPGSLAVGLDARGRSAVYRVDARRSLKAVYRRPQARPKRPRLGENNEFGLVGTKIYCVIFRLAVGPPLTRGVQVECALRDAGGILPRTSGVGIGDSYVSVFRTDGSRTRHVVLVRRQP